MPVADARTLSVPRAEEAEILGALLALSPAYRELVEIMIRRIADVENTCGEEAAYAMLHDLERALFGADMEK